MCDRLSFASYHYFFVISMFFITKYTGRQYFFLSIYLNLQTENYHHGHYILKLCNILENFRFTTSKVEVDIQYKKHCIRVNSQVVKRLKTYDLSRKLGNITKMSTFGCRQSPVASLSSRNKTFLIATKNHAKQLQSFLLLFSFA